MKTKVNPTRMELMRIRKRLTLAVRGHKLLKDKLEGLIKELTERLKNYKALRMKVDEAWPRILGRFLMASVDGSASATEDAIQQARPKATLEQGVSRIMGVIVPDMKLNIESAGGGYSLTDTSPYLDAALAELRDFMPTVIELAATEEGLRRLCEDIEKTHRRTNALEYSVIPDLQYTARRITSQLEEFARSTVSRLMKVKEMLAAREAAE